MEVGNTGIFCEYLKVFAFFFEGESSKIKVVLGLFPDEEASHSKKDPVARINASFDITELSGNGDFRAQVYEVLKRQDKFKSALDV